MPWADEQGDPSPGVANCLARFDRFLAGMSFDEFARAVASIPDADADEHFRSQHAFVTHEGRLVADFVGRYENLEDDFRVVCERVGFPDAGLPRLQAASRSARYASYYTSVTRELVAARFRADIDAFGYTFE